MLVSYHALSLHHGDELHSYLIFLLCEANVIRAYIASIYSTNLGRLFIEYMNLSLFVVFIITYRVDEDFLYHPSKK